MVYKLYLTFLVYYFLMLCSEISQAQEIESKIEIGMIMRRNWLIFTYEIIKLRTIIKECLEFITLTND